VPDVFWAECGNILWKAVRQGRWSRSAAEKAILALKNRSFPTTSSHDLLEEAFSIAATFDRAVYDSLYVALAVRLKADMVTADERFANALAAHLPVKWLGAV
jgi:predicted nucleic acid-binding protein